MTITNKQVKVITDVDFNNNKIKNAKIDATENEITNLDTLPSQTGKAGKYLKTNGTVASWETVESGTGDHTQLTNRDANNQHPISAITNLQSSLDAKANSSDLATVATSGSYNDLENKPTIPSIQGLATEVYVHNTANAYIDAHNNSNVAHNDIRTSISTINGKIPEQASSSNQLADKNFVNSSISTNTATFRGTSASGLTEEQFLAWADTLTKTNNDYVFWNTVDSNGNPIYKRYKYNGTNWIYEYTLNNSSFTASQWASINSGITTSDVTQIGTNTSNIALKENTSNKSDSYTESSTTTYASTKALVDGLATKQNTITSSNKIDYSLISNTPTIGNGTITITQGGVTKGSFTVNQSGDTTVALDSGGLSDILDTNVKLSQTIYTDKTIGYINGTSTQAALVGNSGDTLKQVFTRMFGTITEEQPTKVDPSISTLTFSSNASAEYGTQISTVSYSLATNAGSYTYGPATGVTWSSYEFSGGCPTTSKTTATGTLNLSSTYTVGVSTSVSFTCNGTHSAGTIAKTNLGNNSNPIVQISAGTKQKTGTFSKSAQYFTYYKVTNTDSNPGSTGWTSVGSTSITDITIQANAGQYIWIATTQNKSNIYEWNDVSGKYNTDPTDTTKTSNQTIHINTGVDVNTYYFYRTSARASATNKKFKLA